MAHMNALQVEEYMVHLRVALCEAVKGRKAYNEWAHNLCMLSLMMDDNRVLNFYSYSDISSLSDKSVKCVEA